MSLAKKKAAFFEGYYYKHQKGDQTIALIPGRTQEGAFIQLITNEASEYVSFVEDHQKIQFSEKQQQIGDQFFSPSGIKLHIQSKNLTLSGEISYQALTPIRYDIMGFFKYFPMECRHGIVSLHHKLTGGFCINGRTIDFTGGVGYIERDSGTSFPKSYCWIQCNNFLETREPVCVFASVAHIPFYGLHFQGCICIVYYKGREYRLATYLGVKILACDERRLVLKQGPYLLEVDIYRNLGHKLVAPDKGQMLRSIHENPSCKAAFQFKYKNRILFDYTTSQASCEFDWS